MLKVAIKKDLYSNPLVFDELIKSPNKSVVCDRRGNFRAESKVVALIRKLILKIFGDLFGWEARKHAGWSQGLVHVFDQFEQNSREINKDLFEAHLKTAKTVKNILKISKSTKAKQAFNELKIKTVALKYRLGTAYSDKYAKHENADEDLYGALKSLAEAWKKNLVVFKKEAELSEREIAQLRTIAQYPKFATLIKNNPVLRERFFNWAILFRNNVDAFVQFPRTVEKLAEAGIAERIGKYGGQDLIIEEAIVGGKIHKDLTLPFEGRRESILDEKHIVTFSHDYKLSIQEIFNIFKARSTNMGNL